MERLLRRWFSFKEIGWTEIGEQFTRYRLFRHPFGTVFVHQLNAPKLHPECHDHPWGFVTVIVSGGYWETTKQGTKWRRPGSVLYRPATFAHNVVTVGESWSLVFAGKKSRDWGFVECQA